MSSLYMSTLLIGYLLVALVTGIGWTVALARRSQDWRTWEDAHPLFTAVLIGILCALLWPAVWVIWLVRRR